MTVTSVAFKSSSYRNYDCNEKELRVENVIMNTEGTFTRGLCFDSTTRTTVSNSKIQFNGKYDFISQKMFETYLTDDQVNYLSKKFDDKVRGLWKKELMDQVNILMTYPFIERKSMKTDILKLEQFVDLVAPNVSNEDYYKHSQLVIDRVFHKTRHKILMACKEVTNSNYSIKYDTFSTCIRIYENVNNVNNNPQACTPHEIKLYCLIFETS